MDHFQAAIALIATDRCMHDCVEEWRDFRCYHYCGFINNHQLAMTSVAATIYMSGFMQSTCVVCCRHLLLKCWTDRKNTEWYEAIKEAVNEFGADYVKRNRYESFAPVRPNSYANW